MILFCVSDNELDDSLSLAVSDAEELSALWLTPPSYRHLLHTMPDSEQMNSSLAWCYPFPKHQGPRPGTPWIRHFRNPPEQPGRKRRGPSLATAGPPRKQPLLCLLPPRLALGTEESVFMDPHGPTIAPRCLTAVIVDKIKHMHFQKQSKNICLHTISALPLCSQSAQPFQPLATWAEA